MIVIFDLFETLLEDLTLDFNLGLKPFWEEHYKDKCSFDEIKAYGEELFVHMQDLHKQRRLQRDGSAAECLFRVQDKH